MRKVKASQEVQELRQRNKRTQAHIDPLLEEQVSIVKSEAELCRLKLLKKNFQIDFKNAKPKKKEVAAVEKQSKIKKKTQASVYKLRVSLAAKESERDRIKTK